ncbi:MAG: glycosyltransferase family A protein [Ornithinimicrobium sp.]
MTDVEVIIAVHTPTRPIAQAIASITHGNMDRAGGRVGLRVVCHNIDVESIADAVPAALRAQVTWMQHRDSARSASGPFNAGMRASRAEFVSIMGSDDRLQPGAVASWIDLARSTGADCVQARLAIGTSARPVPTPPTRLSRRRHPRLADPVRDRLSYRSAPLGLVRNEVRRRLGVQLIEGMPVGGDVPYVTRLWCETKVAVDTTGPAYVIGEDATDRVTYQPRPLAQELAFVSHLLAADWFTAYPGAIRSAIATKLLRIHLFGVISNRPDPQWWSPTQRFALAEITADVLAAAPDVSDPLSRADHAVIDAMLKPSMPAESMIAAAGARRRHGQPGTLMPRQLMYLAHREAPPRFMAASWRSSHRP